jgi:hypothetical protein
MRIEIKHPAFTAQRLSVETASLFGGPKLFLDGTPVKKQRGRYPVTADSGAEILVQLKFNLVDPLPTLKIGQETIKLADSLKWYEYAWSGLPILLMFGGGALGGLVGGAATVTNGRIFRSDRNSMSKYALAALITVSATVVYLVLAIALRLAIGSRK